LGSAETTWYCSENVLGKPLIKYEFLTALPLIKYEFLTTKNIKICVYFMFCYKILLG